jgi:hypothetical protein
MSLMSYLTSASCRTAFPLRSKAAANAGVRVTMNTNKDDDLVSLFKIIGFVVIQWGQAEQSLDLIVATFFRSYGGKNLVRRLPKMLEPKLNFICKCVEEISELSEFEKPIFSLVSEFKRLSKIRNDLIHGAIADVYCEDGVFNFLKLDFEKEIHVAREFVFDGKEFPRLQDDLLKLGSEAIKLAKSTWDKRGCV